ncbi:hypothetical protein BDF20DRAFT_913562 [Mycotypha africana]|uniref:uncharacterized protein n=1 Tax=Mycotypha africana TaxID=64632 RepID=UPI002300DF9E|nr:uncharacterized protein BDF20DRAFT_913562 [Mycotypha africana]KAI8977205.1 hypothetical protein BDF20DRAFT_913562 [Mycotypha africana]
MTNPDVISTIRPPLPVQNGPPRSINKMPPPPPPPSSDFRNATIENHWNDPPKRIFCNQSEDEQVELLSNDDIQKALTQHFEICQKAFEEGPQSRVVKDTDGRLQELIKRLQTNGLSNVVLKSLSDILKALDAKQFNSALKIHTQLMTTDYDRNGHWLVGLKRLIDLSEKASSFSA